METPSNNLPEGDLPSSPETWGKVLVDGGMEIVKKILDGMRTRKYAFIGERKTIDITRSQKKAQEIRLYKKYIEDGDKLTLCEMGLTLRRLALNGDIKRIENLREKIKVKYDIRGVHISQAIQNKILSKYIGELIEEDMKDELISKRIDDFLNSIENHVLFINSDDQDVARITSRVMLKIETHSPVFFVVSGKGSAIRTAEGIAMKLREDTVEGYEIVRHFNDEDAMIFLKRKL